MKRLTVSLPDELHERLRKAAFERRESMNKAVTRALLVEIDRMEQALAKRPS